jgi:DNA polymerase delta subunit 4
MPTTRRSTGAARGRTGPTKGQSTISFSNKVTKSIPRDTKKDLVSPTVAKVEPKEKSEPTKDEEEEVKDVVIEEEAKEEVEAVPEKSDAEIKAEKVSDAQIAKYWKGIEKERKAPRVHQQDMDLSEKVLRYFDVSSQYGVSTDALYYTWNIAANKVC